MLILLLAVAAAPQTGEAELRCSGPGSVRTCHASDGTTYVERVVGNRVIRQATRPGGESWTEYVLTESGGTRTLGQDSSGRTWAQSCSPRSGTRGTGRNGQPVYRAPERLPVDPTAAAEEAVTGVYAPCPDTVADYDAQRRVVDQLSQREVERRDRRRRQRRRGS